MGFVFIDLTLLITAGPHPKHWLFSHVSEAGSPGADATSGAAPDRLPPGLRQSAQCIAVRGGPAVRKSHPGGREMETDKSIKYISPTTKTHSTTSTFDERILFPC